MNFRILEGAARALTPGGKMILTTLSGLYPLVHAVQENSKSRISRTPRAPDHRLRSPDLPHAVHPRDLGRSRPEARLDCDERYYIPSEIDLAAKQAGFRNVEIFGVRLGAFSRADTLTADDFEMLIVARAGRSMTPGRASPAEKGVPWRRRGMRAFMTVSLFS